jgi:hypothetical protein
MHTLLYSPQYVSTVSASDDMHSNVLDLPSSSSNVYNIHVLVL